MSAKSQLLSPMAKYATLKLRAGPPQLTERKCRRKGCPAFFIPATFRHLLCPACASPTCEKCGNPRAHGDTTRRWCRECSATAWREERGLRAARVTWTARMDAILSEAYKSPEVSRTPLARRLKVSINALQHRAKHLGLTADRPRALGQHKALALRKVMLDGARGVARESGPPAKPPAAITPDEERRLSRARQLLECVPTEGIILVRTLVQLARTTPDYIRSVCRESPEKLFYCGRVPGLPAVGRVVPHEA